MKQLPATLLYCSCQYMRILDRSLRTACGTRQANREAIKPTVAWACELSLDDILRPYLPSLARPVRLSAWASKGSSIGICQFNMQLCVGHMSKTAAVTSCGLLRVTSGHRTCDSRWQFFDRDEGIVLISRSASLVMRGSPDENSREAQGLVVAQNELWILNCSRSAAKMATAQERLKHRFEFSSLGSCYGCIG